MASFNPIEIRFAYQGQEHSLPNLEGLDPTVSQNLTALFERKKGTTWRVNEEGLLEAVTTLKGRLSYLWNRSDERAKVKAVIDRTLGELNTLLSRHQDEQVARVATHYLFDRKGDRGIGRLGKELYNHRLINSDNTLSAHLLPAHTVRVRLGEEFIDITDSDAIDTPARESFVTLELGDATANHNFWMLLKRKPGEKYQVGEEEGQSKKEIKRRMQNTITAAITRLESSLQRVEITRAHQLALEHIFSDYSPLGRLNRDLFNRGAIQEGSVLERILAPELQGKRRALSDALIAMRDNRERASEKSLKEAIEKAFMDLVVEEFKFTQKRGIDLEKNGDGGSGGARYARDRYGRKILVVKPGDEGPHGVNNPQWYARFKRWLVSPKACLEGNSEPLAEVESWMCDRHFNIWSVPPTSIRHVASRDFVGSPFKQCSLQMFVEGCNTLGNYVGVSPKVFGFPRPFVRWYCGSSADTGFFSALRPRAEKRQEILAKLPTRSLERVGVHNFLIEDVDCHFENILVKTTSTPENSLLDRNDEEIEAFVGQLFQQKGNQALLDYLLFSEEVTIEGDRKRISLIKHDGGSSNPHAHPSTWDYLSIRFKHLFETLPHFERPFSAEVTDLITNRRNTLYEFLRKKGEQELHNLLGSTVLGENERGELAWIPVFEKFWNDVNQNFFNEWLISPSKEREVELRLNLIAALIQASRPEVSEANRQNPLYQRELRKFNSQIDTYTFSFTYHLRRIQGNIRTRIESYNVLSKRMREQDRDARMRDLFMGVRSARDFRRELQPSPPRV